MYNRQDYLLKNVIILLGKNTNRDYVYLGSQVAHRIEYFF